MAKSGSASTRLKFSKPTHVGSDTRFVSWRLITNARMIGNQEKSPKMTSNGRMNANVLSPSRLNRARTRGKRRLKAFGITSPSA